MTKRMGGCAACFGCSAACEVAVPIGKFKRRKASNGRKNRDFRRKLFAKRTIKPPRLYIIIDLATALNGSKADFGVPRRPGSFAMILFLSCVEDIHSCPYQEKSKIPQRYLPKPLLNRDARSCDYFFTIRTNRLAFSQFGLASAGISVFDSVNIGAAGGV
ncbi:UNVERIFIED_ORG: hypothetical protein M2312_001268 [Rhizobium esperanzae]|uniref:hypothetical protein n=1 Tax=Rhizobium phaseoli TaxID=396 RepID=UPI001792E6BE|nr:hypothetical protein [Rhizobium phaseoli]MDH6646638.1 hypothetical protein [Rhizobium esperanzae]